MKLALASDLHLEFETIKLENPGNVDVLLLGGDIMTATHLPDYKTDQSANKLRKRYKEFFKQVSNDFPRVLYVMGNHEHYHGDIAKTAVLIREFLHAKHGLDNVTLLDKEMVKLDDVIFYGSTLWTDFNREDPVSMMQAEGYMNDYRVIEDSRKFPDPVPYSREYSRLRSGRFTTDDALKEHKNCLVGLRKVLDLGERTVVIGHHSPSFQSVHDVFKEEKYINGAYHSRLEHIMEEYPNLEVWTHGHTHFKFDYKIYDTRVVCNPRGYAGWDKEALNFTLKTFEI